ncbi:RHS repeat-associated core domain-containing protein [Porticoccus sp. GXU_MW_L64]
MYDPKIARFLQADPFIQDPLMSQSLNRYAYVWNNPLNATDPSGYFVFTLTAIILTAAEVVTALEAIALLFFAAGFLDAVVQGASLKDAFLAGISSAALSALGGSSLNPGAGFGFNPGTYKFVAAMGTLSGVTSVLQGGKFGHGFASAGLGAIAGGSLKLDNIKNVAAKTAVKAIVGGSLSTVSGGKFANGAISGAFSSLANDYGESLKPDQRLELTITFEVELDVPDPEIEPIANEDSITRTMDGGASGAPRPVPVSNGKGSVRLKIYLPPNISRDLANVLATDTRTVSAIDFASSGVDPQKLSYGVASLGDYGDRLQKAALGTIGLAVSAPVIIGELGVVQTIVWADRLTTVDTFVGLFSDLNARDVFSTGVGLSREAVTTYADRLQRTSRFGSPSKAAAVIGVAVSQTVSNLP